MSTQSIATGNQLEQLKEFTRIVADSGNFEEIKQYEPEDSTTNPTLILKAVKEEEYARLLDQAVEEGRKSSASGEELVRLIADRVLILFGCEILKIVPGRVSTEVDARLSFDVEGSIEKAHAYIRLYEEQGIDRERILVKLASTWEGTVAARQLEQEGIHCNMTLMFSLPQAVACAEADATLVSPFVGRILDWYKNAEGRDFQPHEDPGVESVRTIYNYFKKFDYKTEVMGASFRNSGEIIELAGCDLLTISPGLLEELARAKGKVERKLDPETARSSRIERLELDEPRFRYLLNEDPMATEKLAEGIRKFAADLEKLEAMIREKTG